MTAARNSHRFAALGVALIASISSAQTCLDTLFAASNGGSLGGAVYFDIDVLAPGGITVRTMQINTAELVAFTLTVYTTPTTAYGAETTMGLWSQVSTGNGVGMGRDNRTNVDVADFALPTGPYGMALVLSSTAGHDYTGTGSGVPTQVYADANISLLLGTATNVPFSGSPFSPRVWNGQICYDLNDVTCQINAPISMATVMGEVIVDFDADQAMSLPLIATFEFSTDMGVTWPPCTPGATYTNPILAIPTPALGVLFGWDSAFDGVGLVTPEAAEIRMTVTDGSASAICSVDVSVDNVVPPPTCTLALATASPASGDIPADLTADIPSGSATVDADFEYSIDGGATFQFATPAASSSNPLTGVLAMVSTPFVWDSQADGVGQVTPETMVQLRATVNDAAAPLSGTCVTAIFEVDNTALCQGICGDCDLNGAGPSITDALAAAQISAGLLVPSMLQMGCCDVDSSMFVTITDALAMAQSSAGLPVTLTCP